MEKNGYDAIRMRPSKWELTWDDSPGVEMSTEMEGNRDSVRKHAKTMAEQLGITVLVRKYEYVSGKYRKGWIVVEGFTIFPTRWATSHLHPVIEGQEEEDEW